MAPADEKIKHFIDSLHSLVHGFNDSLIHWLNDSLIHHFPDSLFIGWFSDSVIQCALTPWFYGSLAHPVSCAWILSCHSIGISTATCSFPDAPRNFNTTYLLYLFFRYFRPATAGHYLVVCVTGYKRTHFIDISFCWVSGFNPLIFGSCPPWTCYQATSKGPRAFLRHQRRCSSAAPQGRRRRNMAPRTWCDGSWATDGWSMSGSYIQILTSNFFTADIIWYLLNNLFYSKYWEYSSVAKPLGSYKFKPPEFLVSISGIGKCFS